MKRIFYNIKSMFKSSSKTRRNLLLTVVALIEVFLIAIVSTFAWVEKISSIDIETKSGESAAVAAKPMTVAEVNNSPSATPIDLTQYFRASGNVHLASASSADGENIFFRNVSSENASPAYRKGNINDINVNYISFSFKIKSSTVDRDFCFEQAPTIKIGNDTLNDASVRMAISTDTEKTPKVFSMQERPDDKDNVISNTDGDHPTNSVTVYSFADYSSNGNGNIFTIKGNNSNTETEVFVSLWLEDPTDSTKYSGDLSIENLKIIQPTTLTVHIISNASENTTGGTVTIDDTTVMDEEPVKKIRVNSDGTTQVKLEATVDPNNAKFVGWYDNKNATGNPLWSDNPHTLTVSQNMDVYAIFYKKVTINLTTSPNDIADLQVGFGGILQKKTATDKEYYYNDNVTINADDSLVSNYAFKQWSTSSTGGTTISTSPNYSYHILSDGPINLYAQFEIAYTVTANTAVISSTGNVTSPSTTSGGKIYMTGESPSAAAGTKTKKLTSNQSVTFTATSPTNSNYKFMGWYSTSGESTAVSTPLSTKSSYTVKFSDLTASKTIYARYGYSSTYHLRGIDSWDPIDSNKMYRNGKYSYAITKHLTAGAYDFKIWNDPNWYSSSSTNTPCKIYVDKASNANLTANYGNSNVGLIVTQAGDFTFTFTTGHYLTITSEPAVTNPPHRIVFAASAGDWVASSDATIYMIYGSTTIKMNKSAGGTYWYSANIPSTNTSVTFKRKNSDGTEEWNTWDAGARGACYTYYATENAKGNWGN